MKQVCRSRQKTECGEQGKADESVKLRFCSGGPLGTLGGPLAPEFGHPFVSLFGRLFFPLLGVFSAHPSVLFSIL